MTTDQNVEVVFILIIYDKRHVYIIMCHVSYYIPIQLRQIFDFFRTMGKAFGFLQYHVIMIIVNSRTVRTKSYNTSFIVIRNSFDAFINI